MAVKNIAARSVEVPPCVFMAANAASVKFVVGRPYVSTKEQNGHAKIVGRKSIANMDGSVGYANHVVEHQYVSMIKFDRTVSFVVVVLFVSTAKSGLRVGSVFLPHFVHIISNAPFAWIARAPTSVSHNCQE